MARRRRSSHQTGGSAAPAFGAAQAASSSILDLNLAPGESAQNIDKLENFGDMETFDIDMSVGLSDLIRDAEEEAEVGGTGAEAEPDTGMTVNAAGGSDT